MFDYLNVEAAILNMNSQNNEEAITLINNWTQEAESIFTALDLVIMSSHENVKIICSSYLNNSILICWNRTDNNRKKDFRDRILKFTLNYTKKDQIFKYLTKTIALIGVFDWPNEWPEFNSIIIPPDNLSEQYYHNSLKILLKFVRNIQTTPDIIEKRRNELIDLFLAQIPLLINYLAKFLDIPLFSKDTLNIFSYLLLWIINEEEILPLLIDKIFSRFLINEETLVTSLKCLTSMFISRSDSSIAFRMYGPQLVHALSKFTFPNKKPITSNNETLEFTIRFLNLYLIVFEVIFVLDEVSKEPQLSSLIDDNVNGAYQTITSNNLSLDELKNEIIQLFQIILSMQVEDIKETYWQLWNNILKHIRFEKICCMQVKPWINFFQSILPAVLPCLYAALPSAINEEGLYIYQARGCFNSLFFIDQNTFIQFLQGQQPSINLCYALGVLEFVLDSNDSSRSLSQVIFELFDNIRNISMDQPFIISLLFCLPHCSIFFQDNNELFSRFIEFIITCLSDQDRTISDAASEALNYVVINKIGLFKGESTQFTENIVELSEKFFYNMNKDSSFKMFRTCTELICQSNQIDNVKPLFQRLLDPILSFLTNYLNQAKSLIQENGDLIQFQLNGNLNEVAITAILTVNECTDANYFAATHFFDIVWPILFEFTKTVVSNPLFQSQLISACLDTIGWIQVNLNPSEIDIVDLMQQVFQAMLARGSVDESFFNYITIIREHDEDDYERIDNLYPFIYQNFIQPSLTNKNEEPPIAAIIQMVSKFSLECVDINWLVRFSIEGIRDLRKEINFSSIRCLKRIISQISKERFQEFIENFEVPIISVLIEGITDRIHKTMIVKFIDFLRAIISVNSEEQQEKILKPACINALKKFNDEPTPNFFFNFVNFAFSIHKLYNPFKEAFMNLLILMKRASPGDYKFFEVDIIRQNAICDELMHIPNSENNINQQNSL